MGRSKDIASGSKFVDTAGDTMTGALTGTSAGFTGDVNIGNNDASNPVSKLRLGATLYGAADIVPVSTGHKIGLDFKTDSTGDTTIDPVTRMSISNEGRVTMPYQPMFDAYLTANSSHPAGNYNMSTGDSWATRTNVGSHFSSGTFTAPVAGKYLFCAGINGQGIGAMSYFSCEFQVNGSRKYIHWWGKGAGSTSYFAANNTAIISLNASDYVRLHTEKSHGATVTGGAAYTHFGGMLIG